jgi:hypothetical protein
VKVDYEYYIEICYCLLDEFRTIHQRHQLIQNQEKISTHIDLELSDTANDKSSSEEISHYVYDKPDSKTDKVQTSIEILDLRGNQLRVLYK